MKTRKKKTAYILLGGLLAILLIAAAALLGTLALSVARETDDREILPQDSPSPTAASTLTPAPTSAPSPTPSPSPTPVPDLPPVLKMNGKSIEIFDARPYPYEDPGCRAHDDVDGDITDRIETQIDVCPYRAGMGTVTYTVTDSAGQTSSATRLVKVRAVEQPETVEPQEKVFYMTFDDGPSANTMRLLDILDKYNVKATFFVTGTEEYRSYIGEMAARGHTVAMHSATHDYGYIYSSEDAYFSDLTAMQDIIYEQTGQRPTMLRFPGGGSNTASCFNPGIMTTISNDLHDMGYQYFDWNLSAQDAATTANYRTTVNNIERYLTEYPVAVVLMHETQLFTVNAVPEIIRFARARGYTFLPLDPTSPTAHHPLAN